MEALYKIIPDRDRVVTADIGKEYLSDAMGRHTGTADALVFPDSTDEVSRIMRYAHDEGIPVTPRGAGTNLVGSTIPNGGIVLDLSGMNRILEVDRSTLTATVEPGVILEDFQACVEGMNLFYPPDPGEKRATIGGNISTNAGGMRAVKYGVTRDYVRGLEVVLANGDVLETGSKNVKDASGLDIKDLIAGSEGTLGIITKCILRLIPKPEKTLSVVVTYSSLDTGIRGVISILRSGAAPTSAEFAERSVIDLGEKFTGLSFPCSDAAAYLILTFDGSGDEIKAGMKRAGDAAAEGGATGFIPLHDAKEAGDVWTIRGCLVKAVEAESEQEPLDLVVPIDKTAEFISFVHRLEEERGMRMIAFGHAGDGNVHLCVVRGNRTDAEWKYELDGNLKLLYGEAYRLGGLTSGEHGIGTSKRPYYFAHTAPVNLEVQRRIKDVLDEKHILNDHISYLE